MCTSIPKETPQVLHEVYSSYRIPTLSAAEGKEWSALFTVLTEFCDCSLEQSVDRVLVEAGDEEHLARVRISFIARPTLSTHYISHYGGAPQSGHSELGHLNKQDTFHRPNMNNIVIRTLSGPKMSRLVGVHSNDGPPSQVVVLLLCLAVQHKPNEDVISRVTTLPYKAQCDIMYFIEEALAKMKSNALGSGLFTSGKGHTPVEFLWV